MSEQTFLVFGASGGIGSQTCSLLLERGHRVWAGIRPDGDPPPVVGLSEEDIVTVDLENWEEIDTCFQKLENNNIQLSGVAVCVGSILLKPAHMTRRTEFERALDRNLTSSFGVVRAACRFMMNTGGSIVLISSAVASHGYANHDAIAAAKAGVEGLVRSSAATYASYGIRLNAVAPGLVETSLSGRIIKSQSAYESSRKMHALGRIGQPDDVASAVVWLLDSQQGWVTGQIIGVDGGLSRLASRIR